MLNEVKTDDGEHLLDCHATHKRESQSSLSIGTGKSALRACKSVIIIDAKNLNPFVFFALPHVIISLGHYCIFAVLLAVAFSLPIRTAFEAGERGAEEVEHLLSSSIHYWNVYARSWFTREVKIKSGKFCIENWFSEFCLPQSQIA